MLPKLNEIIKTEGTIQREIIETMGNSFIFTEITPLQKCLAYWFEEWENIKPCSTITCKAYPLSTLSIKGKKYNSIIKEVIKQMLPDVSLKGIDKLASWAKGPWVKKVKCNDDIRLLQKHAVAAAIDTEFDVYMAGDSIQCCLELKLEAEFGKNFLLYQPYRQLLELNILSKMYGYDNYYLYLITMQKEETLKRNLSIHYPDYIKDLIDTDKIKTLTWSMITEWLDKEGLKIYPVLYKLRNRLDEYISTSKAFRRDVRKELINIPDFIYKNYYIRPSGAGEILELNGLEIVGFYPEEITIGFPILSVEMQNKWIPVFEENSFNVTPKRKYWSFKSSEIPQKIEELLKEFLEDIS